MKNGKAHIQMHIAHIRNVYFNTIVNLIHNTTMNCMERLRLIKVNKTNIYTK